MQSPTLVFENTSRSAVNRRVLAAVVDAIQDTSADTDLIDLVIAGDMTSSCRSRITHPDAKNYSADRGSGTVAGKTIAVGERQAIVMSARFFTRDLESRTARTARHEAHHAMMIQRDEDITSFVIPSEHRNTPDAQLFPLTWNFWSEFRVESAVTRQGHPAAAVDAAGRERVAATLFELPGRLSTVPSRPTVPARVEASLEALDSLVTALAYLLGAHHTPHAEDIAELTSADFWQRFIGDSWDGLVEVTAKIPPANVRAISSEITPAFLETAAALHGLYRTVGYEFSMHDDVLHWYPIL